MGRKTVHLHNLYNQSEACKILGMYPEAFKRFVASGRLRPAKGIYNKPKFHMADIEALAVELKMKKELV